MCFTLVDNKTKPTVRWGQKVTGPPGSRESRTAECDFVNVARGSSAFCLARTIFIDWVHGMAITTTGSQSTTVSEIMKIKLCKYKLQILSAIVVFTMSSIAQPAGAAEMDKGKFKGGCESGGNSYVENASDGSFACNLKSGGTIKCADTKSQCTYTAKLSNTNIFHGMATGQLKILASKKR